MYGDIKVLSVYIKKRPVSIEKVELSKSSISLYVGESLTLTYKYLSENANNYSVSWSSSNTKVATVSNGKVQAVSAGKATISLVDKITGKKADCVVNVDTKKVSITSFELSKSSASLYVGESLTLTYKYLPENANNYSVSWSSSNTKVATVSNGKVQAVGVGNATISIVDSISGNKKNCVVTVKENLSDTIVLENFNDVTTPSDILVSTNLSQHGVVYPKMRIVNNEVESTNGVYLDFRENKSSGWAQIYNVSKNIENNFLKITSNYYFRFWVSNGDNDDLFITLLLSNGNYNNYIDASKVKLKNNNGSTVSAVASNAAGYGSNSSVKIPKGFTGWVNFPLSSLVSNGKSVNLNEVKYVSIDIRPDTPTANTYYIIDDLVLSTKTSSGTKVVKDEIDYKTDQVGIFYTIWFDFWDLASNNFSSSHTLGNYAYGDVYNTTSNMGPKNSFNYWGEPALGYYTSSNTEVIKTHMRQLKSAGIDFIFVDLTNLADKNTVSDKVYYENYTWKYQVNRPFMALLNTMNEMIEDGEDVPKVVPWIGAFNGSNYVVNRIYDEFYSSGNYDNLWLYYDDKPFIMTTEFLNNEDSRFTYRKTWALYNSNSKIKNSEWTWREKDNLVYGKDSNGKMEAMSVNTAVSTYYMSVPDYVLSRNKGKTFYNQWKNVYDKHPKITLVGTWNEWGAQRLTDENAECKDKCFTDQYNQEYSNDIEPMKGGHGDLYYVWLKQYVNAYKSYNTCPYLVQS